MTITCTRRLEFDAGHRVLQHESKCAHFHGHRYVVEVTAEADGPEHQLGLDGIGRVVDFSVLKQRVGGWLDEHWDHGLVLHVDDPYVHFLRGCVVRGSEAAGTHEFQKLFTMASNPTAENMARLLLEHLCPQLLDGTGVRVVKVVVHETPNCKAEAVA